MKKGKSTQAIHGRRDPAYLGGVYPIFQSTTFAVHESDDYYKQAADDEEFYLYTRISNPTIRNVEEKLARLENAEDGILFSSGMAAITSSILAFVRAGDTVVASPRLYGMAYRFLLNIATTLGICVKFLDDDDLYRLDEIAPEAKLVYFETPNNPIVECIDIARAVAAARKTQALVMVDNTFASPINQNPLDLGADIVVQSATKYIGGHSDVTAGAVTASKALIAPIRENRKAFGGCSNPLDAFLLDRSLKTLKVRVEAQNANTQKLAEFFADAPKVKQVFYPGLPSTAAYEIAQKQMRGYGGMLCIELADLDAAKTFCDSLEVGLNATSLGSVETLVSIPVLTSHINISDDDLRAARVTRGMVRISIGLEDVDDLLADFQQALARI